VCQTRISVLPLEVRWPTLPCTPWYAVGPILQITTRSKVTFALASQAVSVSWLQGSKHKARSN
jgi:hypothetical protein